MKSQSLRYIRYTQPLFLLLVFCSLVLYTNSDCPIQLYPTQTIVVIGFVNAQINYDPEKQNQQQTYTYTMNQALTTATPQVLIGINSIQYDAKNQLRFRTLYQPTPKFGMLNFKILTQDTRNQWKRIQFNFIATNNPLLTANTVQFNSLPQANFKPRHTLVTNIQVPDNIKNTKPIIQTYVCGISIRSRISQQDLQNALKQIQNLRRFSWNLALIKNLNDRIIQQSSITYQIASSNLNNNTLTVELSYSNQSAVIQNITLSYVIINAIQFPLQNNLLHHGFNLPNSQLSSFMFTPLKNTGLTLIGIRGMHFKVNSGLDFEFLVKSTQTSYSISTAQPLKQGNVLFVNDLQMEIKQDFQCQNCPQSIYKFQTYCLSNCPRNFVNVKNGSNSNCRFCNISQFLIPNKELTECVCSNQYFLNTSTTQCEFCHYSCLTCSNKNTCLTCDTLDKTTKRVLDQKSQLCLCAAGFYDSKQNLICQQCHHSCQTCTSGSIYQCTKCKSDRQLDSTNKCVCGANFVEDQKFNCICAAPNLLMNGVCYSKNVTSSSCTKPFMIESKAVNGQLFCDCIKGYFMYNLQCLSCPQTFVLNYTNGKCQCPSTSFLSSNGVCVTCDSMKYYDPKYEKCLCKKQFFQKQDGNCIDCPQKSSYKDGSCRCVFNYYLKNGTCIKCNKTQDDPNCLRVNSEL